MVAWEILVSNQSFPFPLDFGVRIEAPTGFCLPEAIKCSAGIGPFYTSAAGGQPSASLPIPRFHAGGQMFAVPLNKPSRK